jgi:hypothetical protein
MMWFVGHAPISPVGESLSFASPKESNQRKGDPEDWPDPAMLRKKRNEKTRYAQTVFRSDRFFLLLLGANQRGPIEPIFDRFAMKSQSLRCIPDSGLTDSSTICAMSIELSIRTRLEELIKEAYYLSVGDSNDQCTNASMIADCTAWIVSAQNLVHLLIAQSDAPYRVKLDKIANKSHGYQIHHAVSSVAAVLQALRKDADAGLISNLSNQTRAEVFDDFLDHADAYLNSSRKQESGVIVGVVFEDSIRRIFRNTGGDDKGKKLDLLISELTQSSIFTPVKAKRARAAADVRTKATHAQWDEFELVDVKATVSFTRELIQSHLS